MHAIGYVRVSVDDLKDREAIKRQTEDIERLAKARGWTLVDIIEESDVSAFKRRSVTLPDGAKVRRVVRPGFAEVLARLVAGDVAVLVTYDLDRVCRDPRDLEDLIDAVQDHGAIVASVTGSLDLATDSGILAARIGVSVAAKSSQDTSRRVTRWHQDRAATGRPTGGPRPFGWNDDRLTLHPAEAPLIREAVDRILEGHSLNSVTLWLNNETGRTWQPFSLKTALKHPRMIGLRASKGSIVLDEWGQPVRALWAPLLDVERYDALCALFASRSTGERPGGRRYLLSGLARCGACGHVMRGNGSKHRGFVYTCPSRAQGGCGRSAMSGKVADSAVSLWVARELAALGDIDRVHEPWPHATELADVVLRKSALMREYTSGSLDGSTVFPAVRALEQRAKALEASRSAWAASQVPTVAHAASLWPTAELAARRAILEGMVEAVVISPALKRTGPRADVGRIRIVPR